VYAKIKCQLLFILKYKQALAKRDKEVRLDAACIAVHVRLRCACRLMDKKVHVGIYIIKPRISVGRSVCLLMSVDGVNGFYYFHCHFIAIIVHSACPCCPKPNYESQKVLISYGDALLTTTLSLMTAADVTDRWQCCCCWWCCWWSGGNDALAAGLCYDLAASSCRQHGVYQHRVEDGEQNERNEREQSLIGVLVTERVAGRTTERRGETAQPGRVGERNALWLNTALEELRQSGARSRRTDDDDDHTSTPRCT